MLSETLAQLTRRIADELELEARRREGTSAPQRQNRLTAGEPMARKPKLRRINRRSLRDALDWRRLNVN